jgi:hypothetical protein
LPGLDRGSWIEWKSIGGHKERKQVFLALKEEIPDLVALSLGDRDDEQLASVGANLEDSMMNPVTDFHCRKWRRRYIEGYLVWPAAISEASGIGQAQVEAVLRDRHGVAISLVNFVRSDAPSTILDLRAKEILKEGDDAILGQLPVTAIDVARVMDPAALPDDIRSFLDELSSLA